MTTATAPDPDHLERVAFALWVDEALDGPVFYHLSASEGARLLWMHWSHKKPPDHKAKYLASATQLLHATTP